MNKITYVHTLNVLFVYIYIIYISKKQTKLTCMIYYPKAGENTLNGFYILRFRMP